jgi:hypothetical protein
MTADHSKKSSKYHDRKVNAHPILNAEKNSGSANMRDTEGRCGLEIRAQNIAGKISKRG